MAALLCFAHGRLRKIRPVLPGLLPLPLVVWFHLWERDAKALESVEVEDVRLPPKSLLLLLDHERKSLHRSRYCLLPPRLHVRVGVLPTPTQEDIVI